MNIPMQEPHIGILDVSGDTQVMMMTAEEND